MTDELHIGDRIADLAAAHPEQVAIIVVGPRGEETAMTWSELDQRANAAARGLEQEGVRDDTVVGVALPRASSTPWRSSGPGSWARPSCP